MGAQVISLFQRPSPIRDWTQQELAEFYRVENALIQAGMQIETDRGVTDDGEPWFAFCRADDGEVFIHFARIGGKYIIAGSAYGGVIEGWDFASLVRELIARHPLVQMGPARKPSNIFMHPAALLIAVVGTAFFKTGEAKADDGSGAERHEGRRLMLSVSATNAPQVPGASSQVALDAHQTMTLVAAAMAAAASYEAAAAQGGMSTWRLMGDTLSYTPAPIALSSASQPLVAGADHGPELASVLQVQSSSDWLSLAAVLSEIVSPVEVYEPAATTGRTSQVWLEQAPSAAAPISVEAAQSPVQSSSPIMLVELAAGPLPDVAAVRLVRDLGAFDKASVVRVSELPQFLADFIANGRQIEVSADAVSSPATPDVSLGDAAPIVVPPTDADAPIFLDNPTVDVGPIIAPSAPPQSLGPERMTQAQVTEMIGLFVNTTPFTIISSGDDLVFYDTRIHDIFANDGSTYTRVLTFGDGSTVTLIGMAHEDYAFLLPGGG